jgi:ABC-type thiamine transport system substrate-binding protein
MLTNFLYPRCANTFRKWLLSNNKYERIYSELGTPVPFDVSLRDGLQALPKEIQKISATKIRESLNNDRKK